jgi:hypothetical protein
VLDELKREDGAYFVHVDQVGGLAHFRRTDAPAPWDASTD